MKSNWKDIIDRLIKEDNYRAEIFLCLSFVINLLYVLVHMICGYLLFSWWFITMAFYYLVLSTIRFFLIKSTRQKDLLRQWKSFRRSGMALFLFTLALIGMSVLLRLGDKKIIYPGFLLYGVAAYTFYAVVIALVNIAKYKKRQEPIYLASKMINFAAAIVSMFSLEAALTSTFGDDADFEMLMGMATGLGAFVILCTLSIYMILFGTREMKKIKTLGGN